ncbi:MAG TPA: response regulator [Candidatus Limnocylindrales bacterium]
MVVAAQPAIQLQIGNMLRRDGHDIVVAGDAQDGLRHWAADRPDLIALDDDLPGPSGVELVARIRQAEPAGTHTPIVLIGGGNDVDAKVRALRAGADDYLGKPVHPQELSARVRGLLARFARPQISARRQAFGRIHAYYGAKGGVGTTTIAINTAIGLHRELKRSVALVDGNLQFGDHRVFLDMGVDQRSIIDAVTATGVDAEVIRKVMVRHDSGIDLLLAPPTPEQAELVSGEQHHLLRIVEVLRTMYDYVVVDLDKRLDDHTLDVIGAADRLVVVMTADLSCIKNVRLVFETMAQLAVPDERLMLVLNRANAFTGISAKSVESVLKTQIAHQIINDYRSAISSLNSGAPFMANKPDSALSRAVMELARLVDQQATSSAELRELEFAGTY